MRSPMLEERQPTALRHTRTKNSLSLPTNFTGGPDPPPCSSAEGLCSPSPKNRLFFLHFPGIWHKSCSGRRATSFPLICSQRGFTLWKLRSKVVSREVETSVSSGWAPPVDQRRRKGLEGAVPETPNPPPD